MSSFMPFSSHEAYFYEDTGLWYWETTASWARA